MHQASRQLTQILLSKCALSALTDPHVPHRPRRIPRHSFNHISAPRPSIVLKFARVAAPCATLDIQCKNVKVSLCAWFSRRVAKRPHPSTTSLGPGPNFKRPYLGNTSSVSNARHDSSNGTALPNKRRDSILGNFSAILDLNCVLPNNRQRLGPMSTGV